VYDIDIASAAYMSKGDMGSDNSKQLFSFLLLTDNFALLLLFYFLLTGHSTAHDERADC